MSLSFLISLIFIFINIALTFIRQNIRYFVLFTIGLMWILYWGNFDNADIENYRLLFEKVKNTGHGWPTSEYGFIILIKFVQLFGLSYMQFVMLLSFVSFTLIYITINKYTTYQTYVWSLYFIYPFLLDIVQVRHFLAMSIIIYTLSLLEHKHNIRYIFGVLIASSIQFSAIMFLPFVFIEKMKIRKIWIVVAIIIIIGYLLIKTNLLFYVASFIVPKAKLIGYFENKSQYGFIIQTIIQTLYLLPIYYIYKNLIHDNIYSNIIELSYKINIYLMMMIPLYMINLNSSRVFRMVLILNYIIYSIGFIKLHGKIKYVLFFYILFLTIAIYFFSIPHDLVVFSIFNNNLIFNGY